ncbi:amidohydrolase [Rhizobium laguerreae]|uniref:amidohydrolase n=1 Tax=Rhizobium laguerreae TaxID=1076926 RepID=UPI0021B0A5C7|nr:amidohydrolase [Rhizobium laguerreae]
MEEGVRFDRDNMMRMPKIIPLHAGYPSVGKAAWLSHLYPNCYFELSIMTPHVHQNLYQRYMQVMEVVPLSKILFASDAYRIPELYWLAGRWGKRYLAKAQTDHVIGGSLSREEAIDAARMILYKNNRTVYGLDD